ncbi:MAG: glycosyltransferase family 2 protein [Aggregatilineales bacterium]
MIDLAVVIVTWNVRDLALNAIQTLMDDLAQTEITYSIYLVDSASADGTAEAVEAQFPEVNVTASIKNLGFAGGNNVALRQIGFGNPDVSEDALPRAVYLLNPDTITTSGATKQLFDHLMTSESVGVVGAHLSYEDGSFQDSAFQFPGLKQLWVEFFPTPGRFIMGEFNGRYPQSFTSGTTPFQVDFMLGATMMLKREVIMETGMFDEAFFMYCEETDWQWRIRKAGWGIECVPSAHVVHLAGKSTTQIRAQSQINLWTSRLILFRKHYPKWKLAVARLMIAVGMWRKERAVHHDRNLADDQKAELVYAFRLIRRMTLK